MLESLKHHLAHPEVQEQGSQDQQDKAEPGTEDYPPTPALGGDRVAPGVETRAGAHATAQVGTPQDGKLTAGLLAVGGKELAATWLSAFPPDPGRPLHLVPASPASAFAAGRPVGHMDGPACTCPAGAAPVGGAQPSPPARPSLPCPTNKPPWLCSRAAADLFGPAGWRLETATTRARIAEGIGRLLGAGSNLADVVAYPTQPDVPEDRSVLFVAARR